ncbi:KAP family P-loop domain-containing protein [Terribacillus saccharophilus]|uniref:KAP family P-loop domain-containing protein n=1 Tax=Terribacillus saccharophilus TaxID=361277 RepID=A0AAX2EJW5_9BACI|nr:KAP family P-loop domain-containing protein [Terribacillus saccharophilus]
MDHKHDTLKEFLKKVLVVLFAYILVYEIKPIRSVVSSILKFVEDKNLLFGIKVTDISNLYMLLRVFAIVCIAICIAILIFMKLYLWFRNYRNSRKDVQLSPFEDSLYRYLENTPNSKGYLVTGEWGSGKTYVVNEFFKQHYKFSNKRVYRISCFGLDSRSLVLNEIKNQIQINDNSIINWIQYIPAIGKPLYGILKNSYSLKSIPKGSIFVFDDFERITSLGIANQNNKVYQRRGSMFNTLSRTKEFDDINKEFKKVANALNQSQKENELITTTDNLQKYNVVTGLINELIDIYKINVVIICNVDILGYDYIDKVFRGKLDCITYNKTVDEDSLKSIFKSSLKNQVFENKNLKKDLERVTDKISMDFEKVWFLSGNNNLRQVKSVVQAFLDTVNMLSSKARFKDSYLFSLFYSIYVIRILRDENNLEYLEYFPNGGNLAFYLASYNKKTLLSSLTSSNHLNDLKWTGIPIAGFWLFNMKKPRNIKSYIQSYSDYKYDALELKLLQDNDSRKLLDEELLLEHLFFFSKKNDKKVEEIALLIENNIEFILNYGNQDDLTKEEKVRILFLKVDRLLTGGYPTGFLDMLYSSIFSHTEVEFIKNGNKNRVLSDYNQFVERKKNNNEFLN